MKFKTLFIVALMATLWSTESLAQGCEPVTFDGYTYDVVQIGDQCWFAENLRTRHYANGDEIPGDLLDEEWANTHSGARAVYGEEELSRKELRENLKTYGALYNWYAVDDERGLCPTGWHVPTDEEWMTMEMEIGMSESEANSPYFRGTDQGTQMKTTYGWIGGGNGTNSSGFSGLPGGGRDARYGSFYDAGVVGSWWSSSPSDSYALERDLYYNSPGVYHGNNSYLEGLSVRCLKD